MNCLAVNQLVEHNGDAGDKYIGARGTMSDTNSDGIPDTISTLRKVTFKDSQSDFGLPITCRSREPKRSPPDERILMKSSFFSKHKALRRCGLR